MKTLNDVFPLWASGGGIFSALDNYTVPWKNESTVNIQSLDLEYHGNVSGQKTISPLVEKMLSNGTLTSASVNMLCLAAISMYGIIWAKQWGILKASYDPLQNHDLTETLTSDEKVIEYGKRDTRTDNLTHQKRGTDSTQSSGQDTRTDNLSSREQGTVTLTLNTTDTTTPNLTSTNDVGVYGFNSATAVNSDTSTSHATGTNTETRTGTETTGTDVTTTNTGTVQNSGSASGQVSYDTTETDGGTQQHVLSGQDIETRNYSKSVTGMTGKTPQEMLSADRDLWQWIFFRDVVFPDLNALLTIQIY